MSDISKIDKNFALNTNIKKDDIRFYNAEDKPFSIYGIFKENGCFRRMPEAVAKSVSEGVYALHTHTSGGRLKFATDSKYIAISVKMPHMWVSSHGARTGLAGFDLYADGRFAGAYTPPYEAKTGFESIIEFPSSEMRDIVINFPLYSPVSELYIGLEESAALEAGSVYKNKRPIVYYGSSITQGGSAQRPGGSYQGMISRKFNYDFINLGFSGNAKAEDVMIDYVKNLEMSTFVYDYDHNAPSVEHLRDTHEKMFLAVREAHPDIPVIIMSRPKYYLNDAEKKRLEIIRATYENALARGDKNVYLLDNEALTAFCGDDGTVDGCHPSDFGFASMAFALYGVIEGLEIV